MLESKLMARTITTIDERSSFALPSDAMDALGVEAGAELDIEVVGRAVTGGLATSLAVFVIAIELAFGGRSSSPRHLSGTLV